MVICNFKCIISQNCIIIFSFYFFVSSISKIMFWTSLNQSISLYISTIISFFKLLHFFMAHKCDAKIQVMINAFLAECIIPLKKRNHSFLFSTKIRSTKSEIFKRESGLPNSLAKVRKWRFSIFFFKIFFFMINRFTKSGCPKNLRHDPTTSYLYYYQFLAFI